MKAVIRPRARDDVIRQFRWYLVERDAPEVAFRFLKAVEESIERLRQMPNIGAPKSLRNRALKGLRVWPVIGFEDILLYYLPDEKSLRIIRILHGRRDTACILEKERRQQ